jgi:hypothetical protein
MLIDGISGRTVDDDSTEEMYPLSFPSHACHSFHFLHTVDFEAACVED